MNIIKTNKNYDIARGAEILKKLPNTVLNLKLGAFGRIYLEEEGEILLPEKVYSNDKQFIQHILKSYEICSESIGILLSGKKGLGKSFTANILCKKINLPIIKINCQIPSDLDFFGFLNSIEEDHIIMIDEFEKIFSNQLSLSDDDGYFTQSAFLNYLDNGSENKVRRVFMITVNDDVSDYLLNRPSRIRYHREYTSLSMDILKEIIKDRLKYPDYTDDLIEELSLEHCNIDVLIKIIDEINIHNIPYSQFKDFFNYTNGEIDTYDIFDEKDNLIDTKELKFPLNKSSIVCYNESIKENYYFEKILGKTKYGYNISVKYYNSAYDEDEDESQPSCLSKTLRLERKFAIHLI